MKSINLRTFGKALKDKRKALGISQEEMANAIELSRIYLSELENGKCNPTLDVLCRLSNFFNLPLSELFAEIENTKLGEDNEEI